MMWWRSAIQGMLALLLLTGVPFIVSSEFTLTIIHTNDVHAHFAPFDKYGTECKKSKLEEGKCYGGVARLKAVVDNLKEQYPNTVLCDAGDQFQGTLWFSVHRSNITAHFMNSLGYDVMCVGNHEFDHGEDELISFSKAISFPLISANTVHGEVKGANIAKATILTVGGEKIGFIGYTTTDTAVLSKPERFRFSDELEAVQKEVEILKAQNITKVIALGHAGFEIDKKIAELVDGIDMVIGGHTNTFLYNGPPPEREIPEGPYPVVIKQTSGRQVPVVQDYTFSKYLGLIHLTFDNNGEVVRWSGNPILLNSNHSEDKQVAADLATWKEPLDNIQKLPIGQTRVLLDHSMCRYAECNVGNLVAEGYVERFNHQLPPSAWTTVAIAIVNGGAIRASLPPGDITLANVLNVQPFGNTIDLIHLKGRHLWEILEFSIREQLGKGGFLQFAGLRVEYEYNIGNPNQSKVVSVNARCANCLAPTYSPLEMDRSYRIAANNFLIKGGDGYTHFKKYASNKAFAAEVDSDILVAYIKANSPVRQGFDMRMIIKSATQPSITPTTHPDSSTMNINTMPCRSVGTTMSTSGLGYVVFAVLVIIPCLNDRWEAEI